MPYHPIHDAAWRGDLAEVQRLVIENPAWMEIRGSRNRTPLLIAADRGHTEMVLWLLDQGADPEAQDYDGEDALHLASREGHTVIVSILFGRGFDVNRRNRLGFTPLMAGATFGRVAVVEVLLSRKEIKIDRQDNFGWTALYRASLQNHPVALIPLLQAGADPRISDRDGNTPLARASEESNEECIQLLEVST